jgi:hypothetical protein
MRPPHWEYKTIHIEVTGWLGPNVKPEVIDAELNAHGAAGWELVSAFDVNRDQGRTSAMVAVFKRPRS